MRKVLILLVCILLLTFSVSASAVTSVSNSTTILSNNTCTVSLTVNLHLDDPVTELWYPLPMGAHNISFNGQGVQTRTRNNAVEVNISAAVAGRVGDMTLIFTYAMEDVVTVITDDSGKILEDKRLLTVPLLAGFQYPVNYMEFNITLPDGTLTASPKFSSGYQGQMIESSMQFTADSRQINGSVNKPMNDYETLSMTVYVPPEMFPGVGGGTREGLPELIPMCVCGGLGLLYWIFFLRCAPIFRRRRITPPEGLSAGELGCRLTLCGADLTAMVIHWAQLGYILMYLDDNGRVILHRRMDMGNERSAFENKCFRSLFGKRRTVDGTGYPYALLCRQVSRNVPDQNELCKKTSGNPKLFRVLMMAVAAIGGWCFAMEITPEPVVQWLLGIPFVILGGFTGWKMQSMGRKAHVRDRIPLWVGLLCIAGYLLVSILSGQWIVGIVIVLVQLLSGFMAAYGGRRTELGRYCAQEVLGLRRYFVSATKEEVHRMMNRNPDYFFQMLPYAFALGAEQKFARVFGKRNMPQCPYLVVQGVSGRQTAEEWAKLLKEAADILDYRHKRMRIEKFYAR